MRRAFQLCGAATLFLLGGIIPLQADITLPTAAPSPPPQADAQAVRVLRGQRVTIPLRGHHGGSGGVTFWIVDAPSRGSLSDLRLLGDNRASIVYQNDGAQPAADDRFSYLVTASGDRVSSAAEVRIVVDEPPPHLQAPGRIEFDQLVAGESETRELSIANDGGGVLEGRLTVSAPWQLSSSEYLVSSGKTATIALVFRPDEGRDFIGQVTLSGNDGALNTVVLEGSATSPITLDPVELRIASPAKKDDPRAASFSLTNRTDRRLKLKFDSSRDIQPIAEVTLAPSEEKKISIVMAADATVPVHETIMIRGEGFSARLPVDAEGSAPAPIDPNPSPSPKVATVAPTPNAAPAAAIPNQTSVVRPLQAAMPAATPISSRTRYAAVRGHRLEGGHWELRWARPKDPVARYRIEERLLTLDGAGEMQTTWRALSSPKTAAGTDTVTAQVGELDPNQLHSLKVTALGPDGGALWESPVVVIGPPAEPSHRVRNWTLLLGFVLAVLVVVRWRANRLA
ncbi:MAG TPA: hypothetical protein VGL24_00710 [Chthoniobacterales bacterium]